jgi:hypothetical protein
MIFCSSFNGNWHWLVAGVDSVAGWGCNPARPKRQVINYMSKTTDHVFIRNTPEGDYEMFCASCGDKFRPGLPITADEFLQKCDQFTARHRDCRPIVASVDQVIDLVLADKRDQAL